MDHGGGRYGGYWDTGDPGTRNLTIPDMRNGLLQGIQDSGIGRFDVLFHAACLMSNYETASALAPTATYMAGSEELMFANPLVASGMLPLAEDADGETLADSLVDGYGSYLDELAQEPGGQEIRDLAAMSVIDGDAMTTLDAAMQSFSDAAVAHMDEIAVQVARARGDALEFVVGLQGSDGVPWDLVDLGDFLRHLTDVPDDVAVARDAAFAALQNAVSHQLLGQGTQQATGLNVYLPTAENARYAVDYFEPGDRPAGLVATSWPRSSTRRPARAARSRAARVRFASPQATVLQADQTGIKIAGQLVSGDSSQVTESETQVYTSIGGVDNALGVLLPAYLDAGGEGQVQGVWDYSLTVLTDGQKEVAGHLGLPGPGGRPARHAVRAVHLARPATLSDVAIRLLLSSEGEIKSVQVVDVSNERPERRRRDPRGRRPAHPLRLLRRDRDLRGPALGPVHRGERAARGGVLPAAHRHALRDGRGGRRRGRQLRWSLRPGTGAMTDMTQTHTPDLPVGARFDPVTGAELGAGGGERRQSFALQPGEPVASFNLVSSLMPLASGSAPQTYRWALGLGILIPVLAGALGFLAFAFVAAALVVPGGLRRLHVRRQPVGGPAASAWCSARSAPRRRSGSGSPSSGTPGCSATTSRRSTSTATGRAASGGRASWSWCCCVPIVGEVLKQVGPILLARLPAFDDMIDGLTFGVAAGAAFAAAETIVVNRGLFSTFGQIDSPDAGFWVSLILSAAVVKPIVYGAATGIAVASFSGLGAGYDGFKPGYFRGLAEALVANILFQGGLFFAARIEGTTGAVLGLVWGALIAAALVVRLRYLLHFAVLEAALEAATAGVALKDTARGTAYCPSCEMPLLAGRELLRRLRHLGPGRQQGDPGPQPHRRRRPHRADQAEPQARAGRRGRTPRQQDDRAGGRGAWSRRSWSAASSARSPQPVPPTRATTSRRRPTARSPSTPSPAATSSAGRRRSPSARPATARRDAVLRPRAATRSSPSATTS